MEFACYLRDVLSRELFFPLFMLVFAVGLLVFIWGLIEFLLAQNGIGVGDKSAEDGLTHGKKHMLWGIVGMFIIFAAYSLVTLVIQFVGGAIVECAATCPNGLPVGANGVCPGSI